MFNFFGKKQSAPEPAQETTPIATPEAQASIPVEPAPAPVAEEKTGFFARMKQAVTRTRESFAAKIETIVASTRPVDEASLEELEMALISSDIGVHT